MGANQSDGGGLSRDLESNGRTNIQTSNEYHKHANSYSNQRSAQRQRKSRCKPGPPNKPKILEVTHNSITVTWQTQNASDGHSIIAYTVEMASLGPGRDRQWKTLTKSCQGTTFDARDLESNTGYIFRVRSENIYGVGKPSLPSDVCITKIYETLPFDTRPPGLLSHSVHKYPDDSTQTMRRHYSFNVHIGGGVRSILNHSDIIIESSTVITHPAAIENNSRSIQRNGIHRSSLPSNRKISAPILLPGTANNSLCRLRESRRSLKTENTNSTKKPSIRDSGISGIQIPFSVNKSSSLDILHSREDIRKRQQEHANCLPIHLGKTSTKSIDGDSGKGSRNSLCDVNKASDTQSSSISTGSDDSVSQGCCISEGFIDGAPQSCLASAGSDESVLQSCSLSIDFTDHTKVISSQSSELLTFTNKNIANIDLKNNSTDNEITLNKNVNEIYILKNELKNIDISGKHKNIDQYAREKDIADDNSTSPVFQKGYYDSLGNPWEKGLSVNGVSEHILTAPLSDDVKMALYSRNHCEDQRLMTGNTQSGLKEAIDFRTLRSVLHSNNMNVKASRSLPDVVSVVTSKGESRSKGKLTTILDTDENDDAVRITTL